MSVYILGRPEAYELAGLDYGETCRQVISEEISGQVRYVCTDLIEQRDIECYQKAGIDREKILGIHSYLTGSNVLFPNIKVEDKLAELKDILQFTDTGHRESEIRLIKDGFVVAAVLPDEEDKSCVRAVHYYSNAKLLRTEVYTDRVFYVNYYVTAKSETGLYAKLTRRTFYDRNSSAVYDQILEGEMEWYLFPDGRRYTKTQLIVEFVRRLKLSNQDRIILDAATPCELMRAVFTFGKGAGITAIAHAGCCSVKKENRYESFLKEYPYKWFPYVEMLDRMIVSTELQKSQLIRELEKYHCRVPDIRVIPVEGVFTYTVLRESYGGNLALSWSFTGEADGFQVCDEAGVKIYDMWNRYQHYFLIKGYEKEKGFLIKAYVDTANGKEIIAESGPVYVRKQSYEKPLVSLIIPAYNAEDYIARTVDNALAQSFPDLEIIVVDDGSTDSSLNIVAWYAERYRNVVVLHQENGGVAAARNKGIACVKGKYVGFMDSDDMLCPSMIARLYNALKKNDCDIAITSAHTVTDMGYIKALHYMLKENVSIEVNEFFPIFSHGSELGMVVWNKLYRTSLVKKHIFPIIPYEDAAWTPYILSYADTICYVNDYSYEWDRTTRNNTLSTQLIHGYSNQKIFEQRRRAILFYLENGNPDKLELLKETARVILSRWGRVLKYEEYENMLELIKNTF